MFTTTTSIEELMIKSRIERGRDFTNREKPKAFETQVFVDFFCVTMAPKTQTVPFQEEDKRGHMRFIYENAE